MCARLLKRRKKSRVEPGISWHFGPERPLTSNEFWAGITILFAMSLVFLGEAITTYTEGRFR